MYLELFLPFPPTVNSYYSHTRSGVFISKKGRIFRDKVIKLVNEQLPNITIDYKMFVEVVLYPPDKRIRDLGNYDKALMDAITHSFLWEDDSLIDQQIFYRGATRYGNRHGKLPGMAYVRISEAGPIMPYPPILPD